MTDTAEATSDVRACIKCELPFGGQDDKRYKQCAKCRGAVVEEKVAEAAPPPEISVPVAKDEPVPIRIEVPRHEKPTPIPRDYYWCGATKDSPIQNVTLGGISFPKMIGEVRDTDTGKQTFVDNLHVGAVHQLTDAHVALIIEHAKNKVIRNYRVEVLGNEHSMQHTAYLGDIISMSGSRTRPFEFRDGDRPIGNFVYMVKVQSRTDRPFDDPPTLVERDW